MHVNFKARASAGSAVTIPTGGADAVMGAS
jgi:hypothetical protein